MYTFGPSSRAESGPSCPELEIDPALLRLRLDFEGVNGATSTTDSTSNPATVVFPAAAQISDTRAFCGASAALYSSSAANPRGIYVANSPRASKFNFGNGDFFMSCHFWLDPSFAATTRTPLMMWVQGSARIGMRRNGSDGTIRWYHASDWAADIVDSSTVVSAGEWHHILIQRKGGTGTLEFWLDGQFDASTSLLTSGGPSSGALINMSASGLEIGLNNAVANSWIGSIDQVLMGAQHFDMTCYTPACLV